MSLCCTVPPQCPRGTLHPALAPQVEGRHSPWRGSLLPWGGRSGGSLSLSAGRCGEAGALRSCDVPAGVGFRDAGEWEALPVTETPSSFLCLQQPPPPVAAPGRPSSLLHSQGLAQTGGPECKFHGPGPTSLPMSLPSYSTGARQSAPAAAHHHPSCSCWAPAPFMPPTTPSQEPKLSQWPRGVAGTLGCWGVVSSGACLPEGLAGAGLLGQARAWA